MIKEDISRAVRVTNYFHLPETKIQLVLLSIITLLFGIAQTLLNSEHITLAVAKGFLLIFAPTILSAAFFRIVRNISLKRSHFLMLIAAVVYTFLYTVYFITGNINHLILGYSIVFILIVVVSRTVFNMKYSGVILSLIQMLLFAVSMYYLEDISSAPKDLMLKVTLASLTLSIFAYIITYIFNAPLKSAFEVNSTSAISKFVSQWLYGSNELEEEFDRIGQDVEVNVDSILIRNDQGTCLITVPQVHFGPFGTLGGSNFPYLISKELESQVDSVAVMHGACTHDMNPTSSKEVFKITDALKSFIKNHRSRKVKMGFLETSFNTARGHHLLFDDTVFSTFTRYPETTEDMDFGLGLVLKEKGHRLFDKAIIADEHNSETGEITQFVLGTDEAHEYMTVMDLLLSKADMVKFQSAKFAFKKWLDDSLALANIGDNGIVFLVFKIGRKYLLYLVIDANGISPSAKETLEDQLKSLGYDKIVIMTTDSHTLNKVSGVVNPVIYNEEVFDGIVRIAKGLTKRVSPFTFDSIEQKVKVRVFGPTQSLKLINTFNAMVAIAKFMLPTLIIAGIYATLWALSKV